MEINSGSCIFDHSQEKEWEQEKYEERESAKYDCDNAVATHRSIMRAMGFDEKHEKFLWDALHE